MPCPGSCRTSSGIAQTIPPCSKGWGQQAEVFVNLVIAYAQLGRPRCPNIGLGSAVFLGMDNLYLEQIHASFSVGLPFDPRSEPHQKNSAEKRWGSLRSTRPTLSFAH
jgi:hypothetical protein